MPKKEKRKSKEGKGRGDGNPTESDIQDMLSNFHTPLMFSVVTGTAEMVRERLSGGMIGAKDWVDATDPVMGVTPLMALAMREYSDQTLPIARLLMAAGAKVDTQDDGPGAYPLWMAAQWPNERYLEFLIGQGAKIDQRCRLPLGTTTLPLWIASQRGHAECCAILCNAALAALKEGKQLNANAESDVLDCPNSEGVTPCNMAVGLGHPEVVGALVKAGCDVKRASPVYYSLVDGNDYGNNNSRVNNFDPSPDFPVHHATDCAVRSFANKSASPPFVQQRTLSIISCSTLPLYALIYSIF